MNEKDASKLFQLLSVLQQLEAIEKLYVKQPDVSPIFAKKCPEGKNFGAHFNDLSLEYFATLQEKK